uniref:Uncharacterized protein n=1 Tax=Romanomermis culicivorax TaxID=13658 RepID=A0A915HM29_ROMCU
MVTSTTLVVSKLFGVSRFLSNSRRLLKQTLICVQFSNVPRDHKTPTYLIADAEKLLMQKDFSINNLSDKVLAFCHIPLVWINHFLRSQNGCEFDKFRNQELENEIDVNMVELKLKVPTLNVFDSSAQERSTMFEKYRKNVEIALKKSILTPNDVSRILWRLNAFNLHCNESNNRIFDDTFLLSLANFALERLETLSIRNYEMIIDSIVKLKDQYYPERLSLDLFEKFQYNVFKSIKWYYDGLLIGEEESDVFVLSLRKKFIPAFARTFASIIQNLQMDINRMNRDDAGLIFKRIRQEFDLRNVPSTLNNLPRFCYGN